MINYLAYGLFGLVAFNLIYILLSVVGLSGYAIALVCSGVVGCLTRHIYRWRTKRAMTGKEAVIITLFFALGVAIIGAAVLHYSGSELNTRASQWTLLTIITNQSIDFGIMMGWVCKLYENSA